MSQETDGRSRDDEKAEEEAKSDSLGRKTAPRHSSGKEYASNGEESLAQSDLVWCEMGERVTRSKGEEKTSESIRLREEKSEETHDDDGEEESYTRLRTVDDVGELYGEKRKRRGKKRGEGARSASFRSLSARPR